MKVYLVCSGDIDEQYGCYTDSVWLKKKHAKKRRDELNSPDYEIDYEESWEIRKVRLNKKGGH